ncbi:hydroxymethylglutaryl-CoA synthase [Lentibacillus kapialis]|uniref:Hydroxymethylglutaryl-CoA synthase n=1 Tax=Lentibacillus kapialis TaxID=340214 RepID=A0A917PYV8_9BACI|nr:hydroxymethylglutaryl-CoA synthase [Lentibacillus kapialis]GGK02001.1 hydroxymethylglutaryl-CoA synthase [Lentibacillus kapialis]
MKIGIDKIGFYAPHLYLDMTRLAENRNIDPDKFTIGIGQEKMAVPPMTQDAVTLAANAAVDMLNDVDKEAIDFVIFGTETGVDSSKSAAVYVHELLGLNPYARAIEVKQACYGATAGIQMAKAHIAMNPGSKVLVLGSDIARYGLSTPGEATQGAGAVALLISAEPHILAVEDESVYFTADIMDFWRPVYSDKAFADGKLSNEQYIAFFSRVWEQYKTKADLELNDFAAVCYHLPYTKMGYKALKTVLDEGNEEVQERLLTNYKLSTVYNRNVGNIYTGSLYLSLLSLLEQTNELTAGDRIGMFSYGSGAVGEFFTGILQPDYQDYLSIERHNALFASRSEVTVSEYEAMFDDALPTDGSAVELEIDSDPARVCLAGIADNKRQYVNKEKNTTL